MTVAIVFKRHLRLHELFCPSPAALLVQALVSRVSLPGTARPEHLHPTTTSAGLPANPALRSAARLKILFFLKQKATLVATQAGKGNPEWGFPPSCSAASTTAARAPSSSSSSSLGVLGQTHLCHHGFLLPKDTLEAGGAGEQTRTSTSQRCSQQVLAGCYFIFTAILQTINKYSLKSSNSERRMAESSIRSSTEQPRSFMNWRLEKTAKTCHGDSHLQWLGE